MELHVHEEYSFFSYQFGINFEKKNARPNFSSVT